MQVDSKTTKILEAIVKHTTKLRNSHVKSIKIKYIEKKFMQTT